METTVNQRIKFLVETLEKGHQARFARNIKESSAWLNGVISEKQKAVGAEKLNNIVEAYPTVNPTWLLTGVESAFLDNKVAKRVENRSLEDLVKLISEQSKQIDKLVNIVDQLVSSGQRSKLLGNLKKIGMFPLPLAA